jgi:hypothetical protein
MSQRRPTALCGIASIIGGTAQVLIPFLPSFMCLRNVPKVFAANGCDSVKSILGYEVEEALAPDWWVACLHPNDKVAAVGKRRS